MGGSKFRVVLLRGSCAIALAGGIVTTANAQEEGRPVGANDAGTGANIIVVTAQRRAENLQDVPIAVSAFDASALEAQQIDTFSDLQFSTPNVSFTRGNFSTSNFQIRGIGSAEVAASGDAGVGFHMNDVYLNSPRIADTEFYDLERVEVLRGPQGTLYGRNSTGGAVNLITARPQFDALAANAELQYGNFDHFRVRGMVNVPIADSIALRVAGIWLTRDGYTQNVNPNVGFDNVDGRDQWSVRASLRIQPTDRTTIDLMYQRFEENDSRTRGNKQLCEFDPSAILGCLPTGLDTDTTNFDSTLGRVFVSNLVLPLGLNLTTFGAGQPGINPASLREVYVDFEPQYVADEDFVTAQLRQEIGDALTFTVLGSYHRTSTQSSQGFTNAVGETITVPAAVQTILPQTFAAYYSDGCFPISDRDPFGTGVVGGFIRDCRNEIQHLDDSRENSQQWGLEARISSDFDGSFNFLLAGNYLDYSRSQSYSVFNNTVDYFALVFPGALFAAGPNVPSPGDGLAALTPWFQIQTDRYELETWALFGEAYVDLTPDLQLTVGARYTHDEKFIRDRQFPLFTGGVVPFAGFDPSTAESVWLSAGFDADPATPGQQLFREGTLSDDALTGRVVLDYSPELDFTDSTLIYASYSRGYRGGGFNPAFDPAEFPGTPPTYEPEHINALEIGVKNRLLGNRLQANVSAFYYDYSGLQVVKTVNRALINENLDAEIWGAEAEFVFNPTPRWQFNLNLSWLETRISDGLSVDTRDPTNGRLDATLIKSLANTENCVINWNGNADPMAMPPGFLIASPGGPTPGIASGSAAFSAVGCGINLQNALDATYGPGAYAVTDGNEADLTGNSLQNAPRWTVSLGAQYTVPIVNDITLEFRADYYWQSAMWARIFNRAATDRIESYDLINAQVTLRGPDDRWFVGAFVQNLTDSDAITGHYLNAPSSGLFTNVFLIEPRLYGLRAGFTF